MCSRSSTRRVRPRSWRPCRRGSWRARQPRSSRRGVSDPIPRVRAAFRRNRSHRRSTVAPGSRTHRSSRGDRPRTTARGCPCSGCRRDLPPSPPPRRGRTRTATPPSGRSGSATSPGPGSCLGPPARDRIRPIGRGCPLAVHRGTSARSDRPHARRSARSTAPVRPPRAASAAFSARASAATPCLADSGACLVDACFVICAMAHLLRARSPAATIGSHDRARVDIHSG